VIIFTEALTHGTWPWTAEHERRSMLVKYTPGHISWVENIPDARRIEQEHPEITYTERQRALLTPPSASGRPAVLSIG
jgi:hypothetical protein